MLPLCAELAAGIKDTSGAVCASYSAYLYNPGTLVAFTGAYANDGTTPVTSPVTLDVAGRYFLRAATPFRLVVKDTGGTSVYDHEVNITDAAQARYSGAFHPAGDYTVQAVIDDAAGAIGPGWKLHAGASSLGLLLKSWCNGVHVDVTGEDAGGGNLVVGDGSVDCTAGIQAAINLVGSQGGGVVYFPPGTYKITAPLTVASSNVALVGAGAGSIIKNFANTNAVVVDSAASNVYLLSLAVTSSGSSGYAVSIAGLAVIDRCDVSGHAIGIYIGGAQAGASYVLSSTINCKAGASSRGIRMDGTSGGHAVISCIVNGGVNGKAIEIHGDDSGANRIVGCQIGNAAVGISVAAGFSGARCLVSSCILANTDDIEVLTATMPLEIVGCGLRGYTANVTSGGNHTPDLTRCSTTNAVIDIHGTSNGANWTVNAPTPAPLASDLDAQLILVCKNDVAATGWTLNAAYHVSSAPSNTNGERTTYHFRWNGSIWHEVSRSVTT